MANIDAFVILSEQNKISNIINSLLWLFPESSITEQVGNKIPIYFI